MTAAALDHRPADLHTAGVIQLLSDTTGVRLPIKVVPGASRDRLMGELDGALKIAVAAPPERGAANQAVCRLIAHALGLRAAQVQVVAGPASPRKTVLVQGLTADQLRAKLNLK